MTPLARLVLVARETVVLIRAGVLTLGRPDRVARQLWRLRR